MRSRRHSRHLDTLDKIRHLHRLFQVSLGILAGQHPDIVKACGGPVSWRALTRPGGGYAFEGPRARVSVVPAVEGSWSPSHAPVEVVRAMDDTLDAMLRMTPTAVSSARRGKQGNQLARGFYYMQRGVTEEEFVTQYVTFMQQSRLPAALTDLFDARLRG